MSQATQVFNGVMFITNPFEERAAGAFIRVDVLERRFATSIKADWELMLERHNSVPIFNIGPCPRFHLYKKSMISALRDQYQELPFPHNQLFNREAERQGFQLDMENYLAVQEAAALF
ncbi:hypothetical protein E6B08_23305 [Pseudomonas putida]|uniref:Uncharacterized protein n=1 Tax=Pseudomonas putida TaxID=303 RepID=A0A4D6XJ30_PSEPU|nr:hypothetical protein [Pseudomonas putida]QCI14091.1 hypothetical protein E6B08_23305 [Pseudomonas putida]